MSVCRLYRTRLSGQWVALRGVPEGLFEPCGACVERAAMAVLLDQPFGVVANDEGADGVADLVDGLEDASMHDLLLQRSEQALDHAIRFRLPDEGVAWRHAPEPDLLLEVVGHEVAAVVVAEREAAGGAGGEVTELLADGHADGLDRLEAGARLRDVPAERVRRSNARRRGDDVAVVRRFAALAGAVRRQQGVLAHQAQDALAGDTDAVAHAQAGPDLSVSLAGPGGEVEILPDGGEQGLVRDGRLRPTPRRRRRLGGVRHRLAGGRRRSWSAARPRPGRRAGRRSAGRWRGRSPGPSARRPAAQRAGPLDPGPEQFDLHAELADALHGGGELAVGGVGLALLQRA